MPLDWSLTWRATQRRSPPLTSFPPKNPAGWWAEQQPASPGLLCQCHLQEQDFCDSEANLPTCLCFSFSSRYTETPGCLAKVFHWRNNRRTFMQQAQLEKISVHWMHCDFGPILANYKASEILKWLCASVVCPTGEVQWCRCSLEPYLRGWFWYQRAREDYLSWINNEIQKPLRKGHSSPR